MRISQGVCTNISSDRKIEADINTSSFKRVRNSTTQDEPCTRQYGVDKEFHLDSKSTCEECNGAVASAVVEYSRRGPK
jgi:hypothetical protein